MAPTLEQEIRDLRSRFWSERDPEGRAFVPLADALRRTGALDEALALLADGLGRHPRFTSAHLVASWVHRDLGDLSAAEEACRQVLELDPENARALHGLGQILARGGRLAAGRALVARALELDPLLEWEEGSGAALAVVDIRDLAPHSLDGILGELVGVGPLVDIGFLAPDVAPESWTPTGGGEVRDAQEWSGEVADPWAVEGPIDAVPFEHVDEGDEWEEGDERPGTAEDAVPIEALAPDPDPPAETEREEEPSGGGDEGDVHYTRTMVDLLARQGLHAQALEVARHLLNRDPRDETLRARIAELEAPSGGAAEPASEAAPSTGRQEGARDGGDVADYLRDLLSWPGPSDESGGA